MPCLAWTPDIYLYPSQCLYVIPRRFSRSSALLSGLAQVLLHAYSQQSCRSAIGKEDTGTAETKLHWSCLAVLVVLYLGTCFKMYHEARGVLGYASPDKF